METVERAHDIDRHGCTRLARHAGHRLSPTRTANAHVKGRRGLAQEESMINKPVIGVAAAVVVVAAGTWYYLQSRHAAQPRGPEAAQTLPPAEPPAEPAIQHPLPEGQDSASKAPLPSLADSAAALSGALGQVAGAAAVKDYLLPENIIRHMVVTIDNLPRQKVAVQKRPTGSVGGSFVVVGDEL